MGSRLDKLVFQSLLSQVEQFNECLGWRVMLAQQINNVQSCMGGFIAPDKAAYCVFTQFRESENAIKFISVRTKTQ